MLSALLIVANVQQEGIHPWFFTGVTAPISRRSNFSGNFVTGSAVLPCGRMLVLFWPLLDALSAAAAGAESSPALSSCAALNARPAPPARNRPFRRLRRL